MTNVEYCAVPGNVFEEDVTKKTHEIVDFTQQTQMLPDRCTDRITRVTAFTTEPWNAVALAGYSSNLTAPIMMWNFNTAAALFSVVVLVELLGMIVEISFGTST